MTTTERPAGPARGVLRTRVPGGGTTTHRRWLPHPDLADHVAHFWWVGWRLPRPFTAETLPHPSVHLVFEQGARRRAEVRGVMTGRFRRRLGGSGLVFGIKFRPAGFAPLWRGPMVDLTDRVLPLTAVFDDARALQRAALGSVDPARQVAAAEAFLRARLAPLPAGVVALRDLVERMASDRSLLRAEDAAAALGVDLRTLQRRFRRHVGVSPKWIIQRHRLHEAAEQLKAARPPGLAALAGQLGYADQAHFTRDFRAVVGRTPRAFAVAEGQRPRVTSRASGRLRAQTTRPMMK